MHAHIAIPDLVAPRRAIHFLEVHVDKDKNDETVFRFPSDTSSIDIRTIVRHGERELDKHQISVTNGLAHPHDRPFQILSVSTPADSESAFDAVVEEPKTHHVLFDPLSDVLCLNFASKSSSIPTTFSRSTTASPSRPRRTRKPSPWTINNLFVDTDLTSPTDSSYHAFSDHSKSSRTPSLTMSASTLTDPSPPITPASLSFPSSPSASTMREPDGSASSDSIGTLMPSPTPSRVLPASYTPRMTTAKEVLHTITRVAIPYEPSFGDTFRCLHCHETYALEDDGDAEARGERRVSEECWPWRDERREEGHEFRVAVSQRLEGLLSAYLPSVTELWFVPGVEGEDESVEMARMEFARTAEGPLALFHGLDARFGEVERVGGGQGLVAEMVVFAEGVEGWLQTGRGWQHDDRDRRCRVLVPISYTVATRGGMGVSGVVRRDGPL